MSLDLSSCLAEEDWDVPYDYVEMRACEQSSFEVGTVVITPSFKGRKHSDEHCEQYQQEEVVLVPQDLVYLLEEDKGTAVPACIGIGKMRCPVLFESSLSVQKHLKMGMRWALLLCLQGY
ncbi:Trio And F-Actin-Binding Protein [Manis pentadactyla]|nr:Trio And F-Actin-Binding Protein [Manis pentadactyla]